VAGCCVSFRGLGCCEAELCEDVIGIVAGVLLGVGVGVTGVVYVLIMAIPPAAKIPDKARRTARTTGKVLLIQISPKLRLILF
jgi:hypothetical protein